VQFGSSVTIAARAPNVEGALLLQRIGTGAWRTLREVTGPAQVRIQPHANIAYRLVLPGTSGTTVSVDVAPRLQVQALGPRLLAGEVLPRPDGSVEVWRRERGNWRVVAHPILDAHGKFRTPLPLRPVDYRITVGGGARLAGVQTRLHVTRRMLAAFRN
jgi:hypothetical protein